MADAAVREQADGDHVVEADVGRKGDFDGVGEEDVGVGEDAVDAEAPGFVVGNAVGYFVGGPTIGAGGARVGGLGWRVVGDLGLVEVGAAAVAVPENLELLVVLDEEAVDGDVVGVDEEAVAAEVLVPADALAVVGAPDPGVVDEGVVAVDLEIDTRATYACATDTEEDVVEGDGIASVMGVAAGGADLDEDGGELLSRVDEQAGEDDAVGVGGGERGVAVGGVQGGEAEAEDDGVGMGDAEGLGEFVDAGGEEKILAVG